jgi:riboflavin kinase/FMN adenylyltransferase
MNAHGIDALVVCKTSSDFLKLTAKQFFQALVIDRLEATAMVEGPNFFFGRDRGGNTETLKELCGNHSVGLNIMQPAEADGQMISSTRIRGLLEDGNVEEAATLLGSPHQIRGRVIQGAQRGRELGFPTANLDEIDVVVPGLGVYGGIARSFGTDTSQATNAHLAAIHIGPNPTFEEDGDRKIEVHLLDYDGDLYDRILQVDLITRVRDIARFDSAAQLVKQLDQDIQTIRSRMANHRDARD